LATTKKAAPKKAITKKVAPKKAAPKKEAVIKEATKKATPKKETALKGATKKATTIKDAPKKDVPKKDVPKKSSITRLTRSSKLFKTIISAIQDIKGENIISLDLKKIPEAVADYFIICEANNSTQVKAIANNVEHEVKHIIGEYPYKHEGHQALQWILIDYVTIVVHVFLSENRKHYKLEDMWSDAEQQEHNL
jgi:ribosome-associated protein